MIETDYMFEKIVGQDSAKSQITFYHQNSFQKKRVFPNVMLTGGKGNGKSELAKAIGKGLVQFDTDGRPCLKSDGKTPLPRAFKEINASTIKSTAQLINSLFIPHVIDKDVTVFIDEASEIPHKVAMAMLTMLNPNETNKTSFVDIDTDMVIDIDFTRQVFIFATTDAQKIFAPLLDRLTRIDLEDYTLEHLAEIMRRAMKDVTFEGEVLLDVATTVRGNARQAIKRVSELNALVTARKTFGFRQWNELKKALAIAPLGLSPLELSLMRICKDHPAGITLNGLAARTGLSKEAIQRDYEIYLMRQNLVEVTAGKGRTLTNKGMQLLRDLDIASVI